MIRICEKKQRKTGLATNWKKSKNFGDYLASVGSFLLDATRETVWRHEDESIQEERAAGMATTIAALYEAKVKDEEIIRLVQKYYGVTESDAQEQLRIEKTIEHPCRELQYYLMREEAFSPVEARSFILDHGIVDMLRETRGLWRFPPKELLKRIEQQ